MIQIATLEDWYKKVYNLYKSIDDTSKPSTSGLKATDSAKASTINTLVDNINNLYYDGKGSDKRVYFTYSKWSNKPTKVSTEQLIQKIPNIDATLNELQEICVNNSKSNSTYNSYSTSNSNCSDCSTCSYSAAYNSETATNSNTVVNGQRTINGNCSQYADSGGQNITNSKYVTGGPSYSDNTTTSNSKTTGYSKTSYSTSSGNTTNSKNGKTTYSNSTGYNTAVIQYVVVNNELYSCSNINCYVRIDK